MKKIKLEIVGLSYSQTQSGAYALILGEEKGKGNRRLPIIIGGFEAQAIAIELEKMTPSRPLTHDLFKNFADVFNITVTEIIIYNLVEGIFFAKLICSNGEDEKEIDARTSDAIALAIRFNAPIHTYEFILSSAGIVLDTEGDENINKSFTTGLSHQGEDEETETVLKAGESEFAKYTNDELKAMLKSAIEEELYEKASRIRDELNNRK
jgi:bifunctional DNase/RNase